MRVLDDILQRAKRLRREELSRLVGKLDEYLSLPSDEKRAHEKGPYARTLALSGAARSASADVSSHKGKHIADAYVSRRGA